MARRYGRNGAQRDGVGISELRMRQLVRHKFGLFSKGGRGEKAAVNCNSLLGEEPAHRQGPEDRKGARAPQKSDTIYIQTRL